MSCAEVRNSNRAAMRSLKERVDFTFPNCFSQTHFASAVRHISIQFSILRKSECFKHALVNSVSDLTQVPGRYCCALGALRKCANFLFQSYPSVVVCLCAHAQHHVTDSSDRFMAQEQNSAHPFTLSHQLIQIWTLPESIR